MHPILGHFRRLLLYLSAWGPVSAILTYLFASLGGMTWALALGLAIPLCLYYAFVCLSAWYMCRSRRIQNSAAWLTHLGAAAVAGIIWKAVATGLAIALSSTQSFPDARAQVERQGPLIWAMGTFLYLLSTALFYILLSSQETQEAEKSAVEARALARESELKALKAQVNPHFIFNCLNSISALTSSDPVKAREMCILLAEFLRKALGLGEKTEISLDQELELIHAYVAVEQIRFGPRLKFEEEIASGTGAIMIPPLLLQPLIENAIRHGIATLTEGGWVRLGIRDEANKGLAIEVKNNFDSEAPRKHGAGIGLKNVRGRLDTTYGVAARFDVRTDGETFQVDLGIPAQAKAMRESA
jgi:two-component system, LytTR family, sensor histidine kinase AlgZ